MKSLIRKYWPFFSLVVIVGFFFWKFFLKGLIPFPGDFVVGIYHPWLDYKWGYAVGVPVKNPIVADVPSFMYPMQTLALDLVKEGSWPLWNPKILAGIPLLANFQSAPFSPTFFLYFLFSKPIAWSLQVILAHILAAFFLYLLLRRWQVSKWGSILGGIIFAFSGYNLIWSQWNGHVLTAAFIPLILFLEDMWLKEKKYLAGISIAVVFSFQIFSGYPQTIIYSLLAAGLYFLVRIWGEKEKILKTIFLIIFFVLGLSLAAPQLLPGKELFSLSQWQSESHPYEWAFLPWKKTITFIAPDFFGNHATNNYWGPQDYTSNTGFVGVVAVILSLFSLRLLSRKRKEVFFAAVLLVVSLIISYPTFISTFLWKFNLLGMRSSSAHRALILFNLAVALLAGFGYDLLQSKFKSKYKILIIIPFILLMGFGLYAFKIYSIVGLRNLVLPISVLISSSYILLLKPKFKLALILFCIIELFYFGWKFTPFSTRNFVFPKTPVLEFLTGREKPFRFIGSKVIPVNLAMPYGIETIEGYETMRPMRVSQLIASINHNSSLANPAGRYGIIDNITSPLLDLVNTKYYLSLKKNLGMFDSNRFKVVFEDKSVAVLESLTALPRAFTVEKWEVEKDAVKILDKLLNPKFPFREKIILEEDPGNIKAMYFISDAYYPGWKAYANGKEVKIYRANYAFRAVPVLSSDTEVIFKYEPKSFYDGLKISVLSLVILLLLLGLWRRKL